MNYLDYLYFTDKNGTKHPASELDFYKCTLCKYDLVRTNGTADRLLFLKYTDGDKVLAMPQLITSSGIERTLEEVVNPFCNFEDFVDQYDYPKQEDYYYQMAYLLAAQMQIMFFAKKSLELYDINSDIEVSKHKDLDLYLNGLTVEKLDYLKMLYLEKVQILNKELEVMQRVYSNITIMKDDVDKFFKYFHFEQDSAGRFNIILNPAIRAEEKCTTNLALQKKCDLKDICLNTETYQIVETFERNPDITSFYSNQLDESPTYGLDEEYDDQEDVYTDGYKDDLDDEDEDEDDDDKGPKYFA